MPFARGARGPEPATPSEAAPGGKNGPPKNASRSACVHASGRSFRLALVAGQARSGHGEPASTRPVLVRGRGAGAQPPAETDFECCAGGAPTAQTAAAAFHACACAQAAREVLWTHAVVLACPLDQARPGQAGLHFKPSAGLGRPKSGAPLAPWLLHRYLGPPAGV